MEAAARRGRVLWRGLALALVVVCLLFAVPPVRTALLTTMGGWLITEDPLEKADVLVLTNESDIAGQLEIADLFHQGMAPAVLSIVPSSLPEQLELERRGVRPQDRALETLVQLGVPRSAITNLPGGEGGTTENVSALVGWVRRQRIRRVIVVVSPHHSTRYRRVIRRSWPSALPPPIVRAAHFNSFRAHDWWQTRTNARPGLVETQKLLLDCLMHPF
jgi:hypothetical protein